MKDWFCHIGIWLKSSFFILFTYQLIIKTSSTTEQNKKINVLQ